MNYLHFPRSISGWAELLETESSTGIKIRLPPFPKRHQDTDHNGQIAVETSIVYLANKLSRLDLSDSDEEEEGGVVADILSAIPNWEKSMAKGV